MVSIFQMAIGLVDDDFLIVVRRLSLSKPLFVFRRDAAYHVSTQPRQNPVGGEETSSGCLLIIFDLFQRYSRASVR